MQHLILELMMYGICNGLCLLQIRLKTLYCGLLLACYIAPKPSNWVPLSHVFIFLIEGCHYHMILIKINIAYACKVGISLMGLGAS
jgi:hypothetical protein